MKRPDIRGLPISNQACEEIETYMRALEAIVEAARKLEHSLMEGREFDDVPSDLYEALRVLDGETP